MLRRILGGRPLWERVRRTLPLTTVLLALALSFRETYFFVPVVQAEPFATVRVIIERIEGEEFGEDPDFYAVITIDGETLNNRRSYVSDRYNISPNWEFSKRVDLATRVSIPITIGIRDVDDFLRFEDDHADINPNPRKRDLDLTLTLRPCSVAGDVSGGCDITLTSTGTGAERAMIKFRIVVEAPPSAPGLRVACIHKPIWPQAGDGITVTAKALDGALSSRFSDTIELWVNDRSAPARRCLGSTSCEITLPASAGPTVSYACRVLDDGLEAWSGWRLAQIGNPSRGRAVPILYTGPRSSRIDIVFIPDRDNYSGPNDARFLTDVSFVIENAYYAEDLFLSNQDKLNFWIAMDRGDAERDCEHEPPSNWDDAYTFADVGAIVHTDMFRDCAPGGMRVFSSEPSELRTFIHETGHVPFGLADEYCCDGGYFQADPFPNLYDELGDCREDARSLDRFADACREFEGESFWFFTKDWSVSDPPANDLMVDNGMPQAADVRRINWMFDQCRRAAC